MSYKKDLQKFRDRRILTIMEAIAFVIGKDHLRPPSCDEFIALLNLINDSDYNSMKSYRLNGPSGEENVKRFTFKMIFRKSFTKDNLVILWRLGQRNRNWKSIITKITLINKDVDQWLYMTKDEFMDTNVFNDMGNNLFKGKSRLISALVPDEINSESSIIATGLIEIDSNVSDSNKVIDITEIIVGGITEIVETISQCDKENIEVSTDSTDETTDKTNTTDSVDITDNTNVADNLEQNNTDTSDEKTA